MSSQGPKTSLVTGGCGFLGTHLVRELLKRGDNVRVLDLSDPSHPVEGVEYLTGDIRDTSAVEHAVRGVNSVFHLAAMAGLWSARKQDFYDINENGSRIVFEAAHRAGTSRIVHCSTESILQGLKLEAGDGMINERIERTIDDMPGHYCKSKFLAEQVAMEAASKGMPVIVVNPTVPIGPGDHNLTPPARMQLGFLNGKHPAVLDSVLNMVDGRDAARGHVLAEEKGRPGERYILAGHNLNLVEFLGHLGRVSGLPMPNRKVPYTVALLYACFSEAFANLTGKPPEAPITGVRLAKVPLKIDNSRAREELGWSVRPLDETLEDGIRWFWEHGHLQRQPKHLVQE